MAATGEGKKPRRPREARRGFRYLAPVTVAITGLIATALLVWLDRIDARQKTLVAWADAAMDIQVRAATFHLRFEEALARGDREGMRKALSFLDEALALSAGLLDGGTTVDGAKLPPLDRPRLREHAERIRFHLAQLVRIASLRSRNPEISVSHSALEKEFDALFGGSQEQGRVLETLTARSLSNYQDESTRLRFLILVIWPSLVGASVIGLARNERRRQRAEDAVRRSGEDLVRAQAVARTGSWRLDVRRNELLWSDETYRMFGVPKGTPLTYEVFVSAVHPDDRDFVDRRWQAALRGEPYDIEHRIVAGGEVKWVRERAELEFDTQGNLVAGFGTAQDVTERHLAKSALEKAYAEMEERVAERTAELSQVNRSLEEEIAERKQAERSLLMTVDEYERLSGQFRTLLNTIPDSILLIAPDQRVIWSNMGATVLAHSDPGGKTCHELRHGTSSPCAECPAVKCLESGIAESAQVGTPDGRQWEIRAVPVKREDGTIEGVMEVASDITEKVALQRETMRAAQLASLGELAAGVAHEVNNPINGIINYAQILCNTVAPESKEREIAGRILKEGNRIAEIVSGLLSFARDRREEKKPIPIDDILNESLSLTQAQMGKEGIRVISDVPSALPEIVARPQHLLQVFLNLISNARYALNQKYPGPHDDKVLEIRAERIDGDAASRVRLTFRDRGTGIPAHLLDKVTSPFFTTKPGGKGTGLGLSICNDIVAAHGGTLAIESVEGEFTAVTIDLPAQGGHGQNPSDR